MDELGHEPVSAPATVVEPKGLDERLVWVLSRHKNEEVSRRRQRARRALPRTRARRARARGRQQARRGCGSRRVPRRGLCTDGRCGLCARRPNARSRGTSASGAASSLKAAALPACATTLPGQRSLPILLRLPFACARARVGRAGRAAAWAGLPRGRVRSLRTGGTGSGWGLGAARLEGEGRVCGRVRSRRRTVWTAWRATLTRALLAFPVLAYTMARKNNRSKAWSHARDRTRTRRRKLSTSSTENKRCARRTRGSAASRRGWTAPTAA
jgi:hypothetical protein